MRRRYRDCTFVEGDSIRHEKLRAKVRMSTPRHYYSFLIADIAVVFCATPSDHVVVCVSLLLGQRYWCATVDIAASQG